MVNVLVLAGFSIRGRDVEMMDTQDDDARAQNVVYDHQGFHFNYLPLETITPLSRFPFFTTIVTSRKSVYLVLPLVCLCL